MFIEVPGGHIVRIPLPFEMGILFMGLPVAILDSLDEKSLRPMQGILDLAVSQVPDVLPSMIRPVYDIARNKNYLDRPIESQGMQYKDHTTKSYAYTTGMAKLLSKELTKFGFKISPIQIDYLVNNYTGGISKQFRTGSRLEDKPFFSDMLVNMSYKPTAQMNEFYKKYNEYTLKHNSELLDTDGEREFERLKDIQLDITEIRDSRSGSRGGMDMREAQEERNYDAIEMKYNKIKEKLAEKGFE